MDIPVELSRILITELGEQQVIFLKEKDGERSFPIMIGITEAMAIDRRLKGVTTPRPMTHDLLGCVIEAMGGKIEKIVINDLRDHTFIATIVIHLNDEVIEIDARPSDSIALGSGLETPIFVADHVFEIAVGNGPASRQERIEILRKRSVMLAEQIAALTEMLSDKDYVASAPTGAVDQYRQQLTEMKIEHDAIESILKRLGKKLG